MNYNLTIPSKSFPILCIQHRPDPIPFSCLHSPSWPSCVASIIYTADCSISRSHSSIFRSNPFPPSSPQKLGNNFPFDSIYKQVHNAIMQIWLLCTLGTWSNFMYTLRWNGWMSKNKYNHNNESWEAEPLCMTGFWRLHWTDRKCITVST